MTPTTLLNVKGYPRTDPGIWVIMLVEIPNRAAVCYAGDGCIRRTDLRGSLRQTGSQR